MRRISIEQARRIALAAHGFARPRPARVNIGHVRSTIRRLGLLQMDYVNVLVPAHYLVLFSRLGPYDRTLLDRLVHRHREFVEQWAHEACIVPVELWPALHHRLRTVDRRMRSLETFLEENAEYARRVLATLEEGGATPAAEMPDPDGQLRGVSGWWGWTLAKVALEALFATGAVAIAGRRTTGNARLYDLAERVVPAEQLRTVIDPDAAERELIRRGAEACGIGTAADIADYYRVPTAHAKRRLHELEDADAVEQVRVDGWRDVAWIAAGAKQQRRIDAARLLSPFDPVVWFRPRALRMFGFEYRIEIYTPAAQRRYGYYVLPFLFDESLAARVDLKADRRSARLLVEAAHLEVGHDADAVSAALAGELSLLARWLGLNTVRVGRRGALAGALRSAVREQQ